MHESFKEIDMRPESLALIEHCNQVIAEYMAENIKLTLRQLYYRLVAANIIPNNKPSYKRLGSTVSDARLTGRMDWDAIEDRVRQPEQHSEWESVGDIIETVLRVYRLPRWKGQPNYIEVWCEKDALASVLQPITDRWHVTLMINRGYSSQSAMYAASKRFLAASEDRKDLKLIYLGDHDPSGEDMVRDVRDRLEMFGVPDLDVTKLALTIDQVEEYDLPPNPAKLSDSRSDKYIEEHGESSWELDALPPKVLMDMVEGAIRENMDKDLLKPILAQEKKDKAALKKVAQGK